MTNIECAIIYFTANEVAEDKHAAVFLSELDERAYAFICDLAASDLPRDKSFTEIITFLESHYDPKPNVIAQRFHFHRRNLILMQGVSKYITELWRLPLIATSGHI